jgi:BirA family biotin operon repressor/biotin-[acetyl-CoA-carboxylase] ligase
LSRRGQVLRLLADGREHSGEALAASLSVSRAAVWKQVQQLQQWGLEVRAVAGRGYRLAAPIDLLDEAALRAGLPALVRDRLRHLVVTDEIESTNEALRAVEDLPTGRLDACVAEFQHRGRGRRGREWLAPFGSGICLSVGWSFAEAPPQLSALSLAAGVAVRRALALHGVGDVALKWPNDLLHDGRKLGGILCELRAEAAGPTYAVVGIGLNVALPAAAREAIGATGLQPASLVDLGLPALPSRSALAAALVGQLGLAFVEFEQLGFGPFHQEWCTADALRSRPVRLLHGEQVVDGIARGIDADGALLVEAGGRIERIVSGEVTVRPSA